MEYFLRNIDGIFVICIVVVVISMQFAHHKKAYEHPLNEIQLGSVPQWHLHLEQQQFKKNEILSQEKQL